MRRAWAALARFWQRDESLSVLLGLLILLALVLPPFLPRQGPSGPLAHALFSGVLLAGMATVFRRGRWAFRGAVALVVLALPVRWAAAADPGGRFAVWSAAIDALSLLLLAVLVVGMVVRPGSVNRDRIQGAVAGYLLLGLAWAAAYEWVALRTPGAFAGAVTGGSSWIYYSLVTLTTMGYGDILPVDPLARSLAVGEALTGQLYLAILISRLVALELQERSRGGGPASAA